MDTKTLIVDGVTYVLGLKFIAGYRTVLGAVGLIGAGIAKLFTDPADVPGAIGLFGTAIATLGIRFKSDPAK